MRILLFGKLGQVAWELRRSLSPLGEVISLGRSELNLENINVLRDTIKTIKPQAIVNAAAYTAVDKAEEEPEKAKLVNADAPGVIAEEAARLNALLVHYSTDYIFDGTKEAPYLEDDTPNPINVYGETKLAGENNIRALTDKYLILRTCWIYGDRGNNFYLSMLKLGQQRRQIRVVNDQFGAPTWSRMVAEATAMLLCQLESIEKWPTGIYHLTAGGKVSWFNFARLIFKSSDSIPKSPVEVIPVSSEDFKTIAKRPKNSVMSSEKIYNDYGIKLPHWEKALELMMDCK